jgi:hypothetical protein
MNYEEIEIESIGVAQTHIVLNLGHGNYKSFPADPSNSEYKAFLESLNDNTTETK